MIYSFRYMQEEEENEYDDNFEKSKILKLFRGKETKYWSIIFPPNVNRRLDSCSFTPFDFPSVFSSKFVID